LLSARRFPVPKDRSYLDRDYFVALGEPDPPPLFVSPAYAGRVTGQTLFAIAFRRTGTANGLAPGSFDGVVTVSVYLAELMTELTRLLPHDTDRITLARQDGAILVSTRAYDAPPQAQRISAELQQRMAAGPVSGALFLPAEGERPARLLTVRPVPGWPVLVEASRPWAVILRQREQHLLRSLGIGLPALALMALLARLVWQRNLQLRQANEGLEAEVLDRTEALSASEAEFRAIFESSVAGMAQADPGTRRLTRVNDRFCDITGYSAAELTGGMTFLDLSPPEDRAAEAERFRRAMAGSGRIVLEKRYQRRDGSIAWVHLSVALVPAGAGRPARNVATVHDITDRKLAEDRQTLLAREVDHRAKNALAVVQAALRLTPKEDPVAFASAIEGRVGALARAQSLLADTQWQGASLHALVEAEVAAFMAGGSGAPQVILDGPPISVPAQLSQPLSLALHELATNATKYGALSRPGGQVRISWSLEASRLRLEWREQGGPVVSGAPNRSGFGSRLLGTTVRLQLGGSLVQHWPPEGMVCVLDVPLERQAEPALPAGSHRP
jgi:PAS domain S-box-containing protein